MVATSVLVLAAGLAGLCHGIPTTPSDKPIAVSAIAKVRAPAGGKKIPEDIPKPTVTQLTRAEFDAWIGNSTEVFVPVTATGVDQIEPAMLAKRYMGKDERYYQASSDFPYSAIGKMHIPTNDGLVWLCSATLVGPRLVASARHCLKNNANWYEFSPGYKKGDIFPKAYVTGIYSLAEDSAGCDLKNDWVLYILNDAVGNQRGWFDVGDFASEEGALSNQPIFYSAGYPQDRDNGELLYMTDSRRASLRDKNSCSNGGPIISDADTMPGMSGGPIWRKVNDRRILYGNLFGEYLSGEGDGKGNGVGTIHSHGSAFFQGVKKLNSENP